MKYLFIDCETSGFFNKSIPAKDPKQAWMCQIALKVLNKDLEVETKYSNYIQSEGRKIHEGAFDTHGISDMMCDEQGLPEWQAINDVRNIISIIDQPITTIAHSIQFDTLFLCYYLNVYKHYDLAKRIHTGPQFCTMLGTTDLCKLPKKKHSGYKWPKLEELYWFCFEEKLEEAHDARVDVDATIRCFKYLKQKGMITI